MSVRDLAKKYGVVAEDKTETVDFPTLARKITSLSVILNDLKKAARAKEANLVMDEIRNLGEIFKTLLEELKPK